MSGFGERLRKLRRDADVTQTELAEYLNIKGAAVGKYETNTNAYPNINTLIKIADYFNVTTDYLLRGISSDSNAISNNKAVAQANVQTNNGDIVVNGQTFSPEIMELVRAYEKLNGRNRYELLKFAFDLEKKNAEGSQ